jgi:putative aminopeptidase FrvX
MNSPLPEVDYAFLEDFLVRLLNTPSPTGYTEQAITLVQAALAALPSLSLRRTRKGALLVTLPGPEADPVRALTAHVDTLGAMVKSIKPNGRLALPPSAGLPGIL